MKNKAWDNLHNFYKNQDWIDQPNIFAKEILKYIPKNSKILELGAGQGQDTRYFAGEGHYVTSTDVSESALKMSRDKLTDELEEKVKFQEIDMTQKLPFEDECFDVVYAHLSFHYFTYKESARILFEISRVIKEKGLLIMLNNSTSDPEYNTGKKIEKDYFVIEDKNKRFFNTKAIRRLTNDLFDIVLLDDLGETYKDSEKGIHNLIRFVGEKIPSEQNNQWAVPFVGAIIERENNGKKQILVQTRWKPEYDARYTGTIEIPAGALDNGYTDVLKMLSTEIKEETGLELREVKNLSKTKQFSSDDDASFGFRPFCCVQQLKNGRPWIGFIFLCEVEDGELVAQANEVRDVRWMDVSELQKIFINSPEKIFTLELPAFEYYFNAK